MTLEAGTSSSDISDNGDNGDSTIEGTSYDLAASAEGGEDLTFHQRVALIGQQREVRDKLEINELQMCNQIRNALNAKLAEWGICNGTIVNPYGAGYSVEIHFNPEAFGRFIGYTLEEDETELHQSTHKMADPNATKFFKQAFGDRVLFVNTGKGKISMAPVALSELSEFMNKVKALPSEPAQLLAAGSEVNEEDEQAVRPNNNPETARTVGPNGDPETSEAAERVLEAVTA